jgi:cytidine deaminase
VNLTDVDESRLRALAEAAWRVRDRARVHGPTRVGVALFTSQGDMYVGCNVEHRFRSHDVHAEVNALTNMVAGGGEQAAVLVVAAERDNFTPCGSCLDWIFELGGGSCVVAFQPRPGAPIMAMTAAELMPHYPR